MPPSRKMWFKFLPLWQASLALMRLDLGRSFPRKIPQSCYQQESMLGPAGEARRETKKFCGRVMLYVLIFHNLVWVNLYYQARDETGRSSEASEKGDDRRKNYCCGMEWICFSCRIVCCLLEETMGGYGIKATRC